MSDEMFEIFENLEEGIVLFKQDAINFKNQIFIDLLKNINVVSDDENNDIIDLKIFKLYKDGNSDDSTSELASSSIIKF